VRAAEFSSEHLKRYRQMRLKQKAENASINRELAIVKRVFNLALQHDPPLIARKPYVKMLEEKNVRSGFLDHAEYVRFRDALPQELRSFLVVAYYIGARSGELLPLKWAQVDLEALEITLHPGETKNDGRCVPIYDGDMVEWLRIEREIRDLKAMLPTLTVPDADATVYLQAITQAFAEFGQLPFAEQREILRRAVKEIVIDGRRSPSIPSTTLNGGFLGGFRQSGGANSQLPSRSPCSRRSR